MASFEIGHPWTLFGLVQAFFNLGLAYFVLCVSTCGFFASKFLGIVGLCVPCPCSGVFGYRSVEFCWHRLLIDWPIRKISEVVISVKSRFPFDLIWAGNRGNNGGGVDSEAEAACSRSLSGRRNQNMLDRESGMDVKGKRVVNPKQRFGIRRRKRTALAYGKFASVFPSDGLARDFGENGDKFNEISGYQGNVNTPSGDCNDEETSYNDTTVHSILFEKNSFNGTESEKIGMLERALAEEKSTCLALYLELEKERAAAATAADEAMAMISRLQEDKASIETEVRQYERMIEEKFAYDEEEIDVLKEILVKREKDNHFLEREIEAYRRMSVTGDEERSYDDISDTLDEATFVEKQSQFDGNELVEKTVILVDLVDMNDGHSVSSGVT